MQERITRRQVHTSFNRFADRAQEILGIAPLELQMGSFTHGTSYAIVGPVPGQQHKIGRTSADAERTIQGMLLMLDLVELQAIADRHAGAEARAKLPNPAPEIPVPRSHWVNETHWPESGRIR